MGLSWEWLMKARVHAAMVLVGFGYGGYFVLTKACLTGGVDPFLFAVYRDGIGCLFLFLVASSFERQHWSKMTWEVAGLILALAIIGVYCQQAFFLRGLQLTSVIFSSIVLNCIPVWTLLVAVVFRIEEVSFKRRDGQAKVLAILFCFVGATVLTLYKGPVIYGDPAPVGALPGLEIDSWRLGALYCFGCSICVGLFINLQIPALKRFPAPFTLMSLSALLGTFMFAFTTSFRIKTASEWILAPGPDLYSAIYAGVVASGLCLLLGCWVNHQSGPILVAAYSPTQALFSSVCSVIFLHDRLYTGSILGALLVVIGLFLVVWGAQEGQRLKARSLPQRKQSSVDTSPLMEPLLLT